MTSAAVRTRRPRPLTLASGRRTRLLTVGAAALVALTPAACSGSEGLGPPGLTGAATPEATAPPATTESSPTPETDREAGDAAIAAAEQAYRDYVDATNALAQSGYADPSEVDSLLCGDTAYRSAILANIQDKRDRGIVQTGEQSIADLTVADYPADGAGEGLDAATLEVCIDQTGFDQKAPDGTSILVDGGADRRPATVSLQRQPDGRWTVATVEWHEGQRC